MSDKGGKTASHKSRTLRLVIVVSCVMAIAFALCLAACAPQENEVVQKDGKQEVTQQDGSEFSAVNAKDFTVNDAGVFTDTWYNREILNAGNRGCGSCHESMYQTIHNLTAGDYVHVVGQPGYGKDYTYRDCTVCHFGFDMMATGPNLKDSLHSIHMSSQEFKDNGNCMSCHAHNLAGDMVLWDDYKYQAEISGYADIRKEISMKMDSIGIGNSNLADVVWDDSFVLQDIAFDQPISTFEDGTPYFFHAVNLGLPEYTEEEIANWTVEVSGVKGKNVWTLDEIKALPTTEKLLTQNCDGNINNGPLISTWVAKGVSFKDFIDACGGLEDGMKAVQADTYDGWNCFGFSFDVETMLEDEAILAYEYNDEQLTEAQGYPLVLLHPGVGGAYMPKYVTGLHFNDSAEGFADNWLPGATNSADKTAGWMYLEDGAEFKVGETVDLKGYVYEHMAKGHKVSQVAFSADYGHTWNTIDVPADHDPAVWLTFEGTWTPEKAGTYVLKVKAIDNLDPALETTDAAGFPDECANVIVKVTE
ncbi:MAG: molybdopterin-dependent oxidoreductase [Slackia faecicanis]|nr:molybdopterin-dependent oxidoreductase [Slackia faecicanis]